MQNKKWSKLQTELYQLRAPELSKRLQIHCEVYRMKSQRGCTDLPRYWISLDDYIIWDYPRDFVESDALIHYDDPEKRTFIYPYDTFRISNLMREYINTDILRAEAIADDFGLIQVLKAADRRTGKRTLLRMKESATEPAVKAILAARLGESNDS